MKQTTRKLLDFIPLITLIISAILLIKARISGDIIFQTRHIIALLVLLIAIILILIKHKIGVLTTGLIIILGLFGLLSFSPAISTFRFGKSDDFTLLSLQPIFLLWLVLHLVLSGRYYTGILSKRYWQNINSDEPIRIEV